MGSRCAVLGSPIAHSLSPVLHRAAYAALGLTQWRYDAVDVREDELAGFLAGLDEEWRGLSLTMPLKRTAMRLAASVSERAVRAGAANTLVRTTGGWAADNTDIRGAQTAIRERYAGPVTSALILGGGATATSTALALADLGCERATLAVREPARAAETLDAVARHPRPPELSVVRLAAEPLPERVDVVISTIPAAAQTPEVLAALPASAVRFEVVYDPWPTPFVEAAGDAVVVGGLDLLVHQAVDQVALMTGEHVAVEVLRAAGEQALTARAAEARP